jgi:hypothetical protein
MAALDRLPLPGCYVGPDIFIDDLQGAADTRDQCQSRPRRGLYRVRLL